MRIYNVFGRYLKGIEVIRNSSCSHNLMNDPFFIVKEKLQPRILSNLLCFCITRVVRRRGDIILNNYPSQHLNVGSTLFERCGSTLKQRWSDVENKTRSDIGFSTLHNVDTTSVSDIEATLKQRWHNFILTLLQRVLNVSKSYVKTSRASDKYGFVNL